ncbi:CU044_5270 family protein [Pseudarthrobacter sp. PS3-L1]|uniref:CU044_5270 family protein n=1 Tax=Pseudarthrobacter sp. PS3-L1 TaxID=3046207 RepID=UPI0024B8E738|nr:CU044_5270 family protein [Pseudarthrobacter sp. PS3-L1]MDJ0319955.1 CU044_5270 family protein [Pseudarthrobacter sp. PS3-L1]
MKTQPLNDPLKNVFDAIDPAARITETDLANSRENSLAMMIRHTELHETFVKNPENSSQVKPIVRRTALWAAVAAAVTGALVATDAVSFLGHTPPTAEAAQFLNAAAHQTARVADRVIGPGQYLRVDTTAVITDEASSGNGTIYWLQSQDRQMYVPSDRSNDWIINFEPAVPVSYFGNTTEAIVLEVKERTPQGRNERGGVQRTEAPWSDTELAKFPREPKQLLNTIYSQTGGSGDDADTRAIVWISDRLRSGVLASDLRAALYKTAAMIPGMTVVDRQANLDGRVGTALGRVDKNTNIRHDILIDPANGEFIGERVVSIEGYGEIPPNTPTMWTAVETSVTNSAPTPES